MGTCYQPLYQNVEGDLEKQKKIREVTKCKNVVIMEEFSFLYIDWINAFLDCVKETEFLEMLNDCTMDQLIGHRTIGDP